MKKSPVFVLVFIGPSVKLISKNRESFSPENQKFLRKRGHLVRLRTSLIVSLQNILARNVGTKTKTSAIKALREDRVTPLLAGNDDICLAGRVSKDAIDSFSKQISAIEVAVEKKLELRQPYDLLLSMPGVGRVLALTIVMETGPIERFLKVGSYVSYCRKVLAGRFSNDKKKGNGNRKNGNKYLSWAYAEAAEFARRFDSEARAYYDRKQRRTKCTDCTQCACAQVVEGGVSHHEG